MFSNCQEENSKIHNGLEDEMRFSDYDNENFHYEANINISNISETDHTSSNKTKPK